MDIVATLGASLILVLVAAMWVFKRNPNTGGGRRHGTASNRFMTTWRTQLKAARAIGLVLALGIGIGLLSGCATGSRPAHPQLLSPI